MAMQSTTKRPLSQRWADYQPSKAMLCWACVAAVVATMVIGFSWGGWVTGSTSRAEAATAGDAARGELASAICIDRFNAGPDASARLAQLKALTESYKQRQFIEAGGWATMPGQSSPDRLGVQGCTTALAA